MIRLEADGEYYLSKKFLQLSSTAERLGRQTGCITTSRTNSNQLVAYPR